MELILIIVWLGCGLGAMAVANQRGGSGCAGLALGFLLGPLGLALSFAVFDGIQCPSCQRTISAKAERCPECLARLHAPADSADRETRQLVEALQSGRPLSATRPAPNAASKKCPDCAEEVKAEARKCRFCGYLFTA